MPILVIRPTTPWGQRGVCRRMGVPSHSDLFAFKLFNAACLMDHMEHVGHCLRGMVYVTLQVDKRRPLFEYAVP